MRSRRGWLAAVAVAATVAMAASAPLAAADDATQQETVSFAGYQATNPCTGENVAFSLSMHETSHTTLSSSGGSMVANHVNFADFQGIGDLGTRYHGQATATSTFHDVPGFVDTGAGDLRLISQGSAANFEAHFVYHVTQTPSGQLVGQVDLVDQTCQG